MIQEIIEIILKDDIQQVFNRFSECFNIRIAFFSAVGKELKVGLNRPLSEFCSIINRKLKKGDICLENDKEYREKAKAQEEMITYTCHAGLIESVTPIFIDGHLIGYVMIGQVRSSKKLSSVVYKNLNIGIDEQEFLSRAFNEIPYYPKDKLESIIDIFSFLVDYIITKNMVHLKKNIIIEKIITFAEEHPGNNISLEDATRLVGKSSSTISHLFSKYYNKGFRQVMIDIKIRKAVGYMETDPEMRIGEISALLGFTDQFYFSRLFKKRTGVSPSNFLQQSQRLN